jgi:hypothetical protein
MDMTRMNDILDMLRGMKGTVEAFVLDDGCRERIIKIEKSISGAMGIPIINKGVEECLHRKYVVCIIKKEGFRPPPEPTVLLLTDTGLVLGEEVLPPYRKKFLENVNEYFIWLADDFVVYPDRRGGTKEFFIMPPVSFPEVSEMGMKNVVSCSPSAPSDIMLRKEHGFEDNPKLASILIGFDSDENLEP